MIFDHNTIFDIFIEDDNNNLIYGEDCLCQPIELNQKSKSSEYQQEAPVTIVVPIVKTPDGIKYNKYVT
ncbi:12869_t:CDS:2 [Racocetra fulgida]|uniref:12869_t:CDS:1 n=1 Tax=Racocetra fulgida TaxID=60492 RepID=A0A9N9FEL4_9GLOM|nr:12869_t:CDS:2 [Racocetra fulgida]